LFINARWTLDCSEILLKGNGQPARTARLFTEGFLSHPLLYAARLALSMQPFSTNASLILAPCRISLMRRESSLTPSNSPFASRRFFVTFFHYRLSHLKNSVRQIKPSGSHRARTRSDFLTCAPIQ
jgi:hypothetical protein